MFKIFSHNFQKFGFIWKTLGRAGWQDSRNKLTSRYPTCLIIEHRDEHNTIAKNSHPARFLCTGARPGMFRCNNKVGSWDYSADIFSC